MATNTTNYQLKKPATTDYVTIGDINDNMDKIDAQMKANADAIASKAGTSVATQSANGLMSSADKTKLDGVDSALAGKVSKSGDTMTGTLTLQQGGWNNLTFKHTKYDVLNPSGEDERTLNICAYDVNTKITTSLTTSNNTNYVRTYLGSYGYKSDGTRISSTIDIFANRDGTTYANAPSWSPGTNDNSDKILTIKMANSLPSLVHTTGNEVIAGIKTFTANPTIRADNLEAGLGLLCNKAVGDITGWTRNALIGFFWKDYVYNGFITTTRDPTNSAMEMTASNGNGANSSILIIQPNNGSAGWATAPTTPSGATGNEIATADWALSKFIKKSGDTMTGTLTLPRVNTKSNEMELGAIPSANQFLDNSLVDKDGSELVLERLYRGNNGDIIKQLGIRDRSGNFHWVNLLAVTNGGDYAVAPSWSVGTNDNSDKVLTIKMANSLPSLVHTTGNETIAGNKTFTGAFGLLTANSRFIVKDTDGDSTVQPSSNQTPFYLQVLDKKGKVFCNLVSVTHRASDNAIISSFGNSGRTWSGGIRLTTLPDGTEYADCPTTPNNATSKEIVTANWALSKFQRKITYGTGDPPSGGQAGDIYIKI